MPDDLNLSYVEAPELNDAERADQIGCDAEEDDDYDPPLPYDYREQWAENPVGWALSYADGLIRQFECGPDFYRDLDSAIIEQWLFEDYPDLRETLGGAMNALRIGLIQRCRMHQAAAMLASMFAGVPIGAVRPVESLIAACEEFFPGWLSIIMTVPRWKWSATLPGPIAELRGKWLERESFRAHDSGRRVPYSRRSDWLCIDAMDDGQHGVTAYLLEGPTFPASMRWCTRERCALAVHAPVGATVESLAGLDGVALAISGDGQQASLDLSFGLGTLSLSATEHEPVLLRFRNRLPVVYMLEGEHLLVEYEWNPIAFGREYLRLARETGVVNGVADLPQYLTGHLHDDTIRIDRIRPAKQKTFQDTDDDSIPF